MKMKYKVASFFIILSTVASYNLVAQSKLKNTGPKVKNAKPWNNTQRTSLYTLSRSTTLYGVEAKNAKAWQASKKGKRKSVIGRTSMPLMGPAAKNRKRWK